MRCFPVEDSSGAQFELYEYRVPRPILGFILKVTRYELDTGEPAECVDEDTFALVSTGEKLKRVRA